MAPVRSKENFLVFGAPLIEEPEIAEVVDSLRRGWLGTGPKVHRFEADFVAYKGGWGHPAALFSATSALHLSLLAAGVGPGDEVITTPMTFAATVNAILHTGATPVLADVDPDTQNIDPREVAARVTPRTKALLPVHFAGRPCDMDALCAIANQHGLKLIEDCAHAIETTYKGRHAGTFGDFGCFSFYATKNVAMGEGGLVLAARAEDAARVKVLGLHGMSRDAWKRFTAEGYKHYEVVEVGFKYNMTDIQASLGLHQLARVERNWARRDAQWARYQRELADLPVGRPVADEADTHHARHLYTIRVDEPRAGVSRDQFLTRMTAEGVGVGVHYQSVAEHPVYRERLGWHPDAWPHARAIGQQTVSLNLTPKMTDDEQTDVITAVRKVLGA